MSTTATLETLLEFEEGRRNKPYICTGSHWTYGVGHKMTEDEVKKYPPGCIIPDDVIDKVFTADKQKAVNAAKGYAWFQKLNDARQAVIVSMIFQLGTFGFAKFQNTIKLISKGNYDGAAAQMLRSLWAKQTPNRAKRHSEQFKTGVWCEEYGHDRT